MAPVRSLNVETRFEGPAWETALSPVISERAKNGKRSRLGEGTTESPDSDSSPSPPELKFVTTTGPPSQRSKESRLVVRSHAMQAFLREKKLDGKNTAKREPEVQVKSLDEAIGRFKLSSWSRKSSKKASSAAKNETIPKQATNDSIAKISMKRPKDLHPMPSPQSILGQLDPFGILPIALTPRIQSLLLHCKPPSNPEKYITPSPSLETNHSGLSPRDAYWPSKLDTTEFTMNSIAVNPEGSWLSFALTDAGLLHATLSLVAYHYDITHGRDESLDCLYQKGEAIKRMNHRLGDSHQQFSDTTIATVSLFANIETMSGTRPISDVHMTALERMVIARGGLDKFNHNKVLQRVLTWADIIYSSTWNCPPRFPLLESYRNEDYIGSLQRFSSIYNPYLPDYDSYSWCQSNPNMYNVLESLRRISTAVASPDLSPADRTAISNKIYTLEHMLLSSQNATEIYEPRYDTETDLSEPFRFAALLYAHIILRELPHTAKMHSKLVSNLKFMLEEQSAALVHTTSRQTLELLAWIFFIGGAAAADVGERRYFVTLLVRVCSGLGLEGGGDLRGTLQGVVWLDRVCEGYFAKLWKEMTLV